MLQLKEFFQYLVDIVKIWVIVQPWESGIRVRMGKHIKDLNKGIYFKIPYLDSVYIQENRLRVVEAAMQTLTSKDNQTITLNSSFGYVIKDVRKLYETLYHPEMTLQNIVMSELANIVYSNNIKDITISDIESKVMFKLNSEDYGIDFKYFKLTNFAIVKTFRLIQDQSWVSEGLNMNSKR